MQSRSIAQGLSGPKRVARGRRYMTALAGALLSVTPQHATLPNAKQVSVQAARGQRTMRKAILLDVTVDVQLWVEGDDSPPHDFARSAASTVREVITAGARTQRPLQMVIRDIHELETP